MIDGGIDAHAEPAGRMIGQDLAGRGPERLRVFRIDAALDGVAVEFHVVLRELEVAAGGDADLLDHEVDVGDHLGHRMLDLDARVHLDEIELAVLVQEFDGADAEIFELAHRLGDRLADAVAAGDVERGRGAFLPDLLVAALQRAVALAEMDGAAMAVAEHLDFDVARPARGIFRDRPRRRRRRPALRSARWRARWTVRRRVCATFMPRPPPPAAALTSTGKPIAFAIASASWSEVTPPSEPGTTGMPSRLAVRLASILSPIRRMWLGFGPMKWMLCSSRISAKRAFSDRKP